MIKARTVPLALISILLPLLALLVACAADDTEPTAAPLIPTVAPVEEPRPLTTGERETIDEFAGMLQAAQDQRDEFYQEFETWRAGLTECHPATARESMSAFAASYIDITERAANLPRTASTKELADLLIPAAEAEEAAYRELRDRWQTGNISLFEQVELRRNESVRARKSAEDLSLALQEEFEEGPTEGEVEDMEEFADTFDEITDDWDDYHDAYRDLTKSEAKLTQAELRAQYLQLIEQFEEISATISELSAPLGNEDIEDIIETMQDLAKDELSALERIADSLLPADGVVAQPTPAPTAPAAPPAEGQSAPESSEANVAPVESLPSPQEELEAAVEESIESLEDISQTIEETVEDKSAEYLADVKNFNTEYRGLVREWDSFHGQFSDWRESNGGCDQVEVTGELEQFSQQAGALARQVRDLPQAGFLLPIYSLVVEAAEVDETAMRTLYTSWRPFAVDVFRAVDEERLNSDRLRRQAGIALQELRERP